MTTRINTTITISLILSMCFGILLHFVYELSNYNRVAGLFAPINESTWEELKILYFPFLLFTIILYCVTKRNSQNILFANSVAISIGMMLVIVLHYTVEGVFGICPFPVDIGIFFLCNIISYILCSIFIKNNTFFVNDLYGFLTLTFLFLLFVLFTFLPPRIPLFQDSLTKSFGIIRP